MQETHNTARHTLACALNISADDLRFDGLPYRAGDWCYAATATGWGKWPPSPESVEATPNSGPVLFELGEVWDDEALRLAPEAEIAQACEGLPQFQFGYVKTQEDAKPKPKSGPWKQFLSQLTEPAIRADKNGPGFMPAIFGKPHRCNENVTALTALVLDLDGTHAPVSRDAFEVALAGYTYFAYTTFNHAPGAERWRIILPLQRNATVEEHRAMFKWAGDKLGGMMDAACKDASRLYYLPACPAERREHYQWTVSRGQPLNPDDYNAADSEQGNDSESHEGATTRDAEWTLDKIIYGVLAGLDADMGYEKWLIVLQGMHSQFARTEHEPMALQAVIEWSQSADDKSRIAPAEVIKKKWQGFNSDGGITIAALVKMAGGREVCLRRVAEHDAKAKAHHENPGDDDASTQGKSSRGTLFRSLAALREARKPRRWLVRDHIPSDSTGLICGKSGSTKTFVAIDLACHIAHDGLDWCGHATQHGPVFYIAGEGGDGLIDRIDAWRKHHEHHGPDPDLWVCNVPLRLNNIVDATKVADAIKARRLEIGTPKLIVVDTLSQNFEGDENEAGKVASFFRNLTTMIRSLCPGGCILILHHCGHDTSRLRGSYTILANNDFVYRLEASHDDDGLTSEMTCEKMRDGEKPSRVGFVLYKVPDVREEETGAAVSSLAAQFDGVREDRGGQQGSTKGGRPRASGKHVMTLLKVLHDLGRPASLTEVREAFYAAYPGEKQDTKRTAFTRALRSASEAGLFRTIEGGLLSLNSEDADL
jgi:hypothetical protein